jgi:glyoxylase-like metal-dependent hydrolase (beta-lactamase superfamily II)
MSKYKLNTLVLGIVQTNCYIISNADTKEAIVIDPADYAPSIIKLLQENDLVCKAILLTHGHFDHIMAASELAAAAGVKVYAHEAEVALLADPFLNSSYNIHRECSLVPDVCLKDGQMLKLAGFTIKVIHTPGHTAGGVCYYLTENGVLFSGDTLFLEDIGRSDLPTGNSRLLVESIKNKLMPLEDGIIVYPGHEEPTTIGYEREHNIYINGELY